MDAIEIIVSPRVLCPCGKSALRMNREQRMEYIEAINKIQESRLRHAEKDTTDTTDADCRVRERRVES